MNASTLTVSTHSTEAMSIVNKKTEVKLLLILNDDIQEAKVALHAEDTLGDYEHTAILLLSKLCGVLEL